MIINKPGSVPLPSWPANQRAACHPLSRVGGVAKKSPTLVAVLNRFDDEEWIQLVLEELFSSEAAGGALSWLLRCEYR